MTGKPGSYGEGWASKSGRLLELDRRLQGNLLDESNRTFLRCVVAEPVECYYMDKAWIERQTSVGMRWLEGRGAL